MEQSNLYADNVYAEVARFDVILKKIGNRDDCLFHTYIGRCNDSARKKLDKIEANYTNIKFFYETEYNELISRISEYDYGSFFMTDGRDVPEQESIDNVCYGHVYIDSVTNRFFDYLDAGIPIISTLPRKLCEYLDSYGVLVKMNISNLDIDYLRKNKMFYRQNVKRAKEELHIEKHIQRLIDWFHKL